MQKHEQCIPDEIGSWGPRHLCSALTLTLKHRPRDVVCHSYSDAKMTSVQSSAHTWVVFAASDNYCWIWLDRLVPKRLVLRAPSTTATPQTKYYRWPQRLPFQDVAICVHPNAFSMFIPTGLHSWVLHRTVHQKMRGFALWNNARTNVHK